jgi:hypothetical protein
MADSRPSELDQLRLENARLIALLEAHGIAWRSSEQPRSEPTPVSAQPLPGPFRAGESGPVPASVPRS